MSGNNNNNNKRKRKDNMTSHRSTHSRKHDEELSRLTKRMRLNNKARSGNTVGRRLCSQLLQPANRAALSTVVLPPSLEPFFGLPNDGRNVDQEPEYTPGEFVCFDETISAKANAEGDWVVMVACGAVGYNNFGSALVSNGLYVGGMAGLPTQIQAGWIPHQIGEIQIPRSTPVAPERDRVNCVLTGLQMTYVTDSSEVQLRKGRVYAAWASTTNGQTVGVLDEQDGVAKFSNAILEEGDEIIARMPPRAMCINNINSGDTAVGWGAAPGGYLYLFGKGGVPSASATIRIKGGLFYFGWGTGNAIIPIISQDAYDCARSCFLSVFRAKVANTAEHQGLVLRAMNSFTDVYHNLDVGSQSVGSVMSTIRDISFKLAGINS